MKLKFTEYVRIIMFQLELLKQKFLILTYFLQKPQFSNRKNLQKLQVMVAPLKAQNGSARRGFILSLKT